MRFNTRNRQAYLLARNREFSEYKGTVEIVEEVRIQVNKSVFDDDKGVWL